MYIETRNLTKRFDGTSPDTPPAVSNASVSVEKGSLTALLGPSGSGKTTLLRMIAGLETPSSGDIYIDGQRVNDLSPSERRIGFVFQNYALFRYMTVYENIAFGLRVQKRSNSDIKKRVAELLELVGLSGMENRYPNQLSGGQCQRVAFARALAPEPALLLLDEPFAAIDAKVRKELRLWLRDMIYKVGITSIFVTHDQDEAVEVADQIIVTNKGCIEQIGSPSDIYKDPKTPFVAKFIGNGTVIDDYRKIPGFDSGDYQGAVIRPEFIEAFKSDNPRFKDLLPLSEKAIIKDILFRGNSLEVKLDVNGVTLTALRSLERRPIHIGEEMNIIVYRLLAFDDKKAYLLRNDALMKIDPNAENSANYAYGSDGYFVI
jgi:sulfate transport system ATP-binding protein